MSAFTNHTNIQSKLFLFCEGIVRSWPQNEFHSVLYELKQLYSNTSKRVDLRIRAAIYESKMKLQLLDLCSSMVQNWMVNAGGKKASVLKYIMS